MKLSLALVLVLAMTGGTAAQQKMEHVDGNPIQLWEPQRSKK